MPSPKKVRGGKARDVPRCFGYVCPWASWLLFGQFLTTPEGGHRQPVIAVSAIVVPQRIFCRSARHTAPVPRHIVKPGLHIPGRRPAWCCLPATSRVLQASRLRPLKPFLLNPGNPRCSCSHCDLRRKITATPRIHIARKDDSRWASTSHFRLRALSPQLVSSCRVFIVLDEEPSFLI